MPPGQAFFTPSPNSPLPSNVPTWGEGEAEARFTPRREGKGSLCAIQKRTVEVEVEIRVERQYVCVCVNGGEGLLPRGVSHEVNPVLLQLGSQKCTFVLQFFDLGEGRVEKEKGGKSHKEKFVAVANSVPPKVS